MKDRIRQLMDSQQLSQQRFAEMLEISPASLSSIFNERTKPTLNHVDAIRKNFPNINLNWLLYGVGDMFNTPGNQNTAASSAVSPQLPLDQTLDFAEPDPTPLQGNDFPQSKQQNTFQTYKPEIKQVKIIDKQPRRISEIRIFYDDQTWESFVPKDTKK